MTNGLWALPVPIPDNPLGYVVCYAFEADDGVVLVDPGWDAPECLAALGAGLATAGATMTDVIGVVVTHYHPDHGGLADAVRREAGAWVAMHPADAERIAHVAKPLDRLLRTNLAWLTGAGAPREVLADLVARIDTTLVPHSAVPTPDRLIVDGELVAARGLSLRALHTPGHTPGHLCLLDEQRRVLLTGDHVLPRITPNVGFHPMSTADPLADFVASLERLRHSEAELFLPAHEWAFDDLDGRIDVLLEHHHARLAETESILGSGPLSAWQVAQRLTWRRAWSSYGTDAQRAALSETMAHLIALRSEGRAHCAGSEPAQWSLPADPCRDQNM